MILKNLKWQGFYLLRFWIGIYVFFDDFAVMREVPCVALPTLIWFSDKSLWVKSSGKGSFWAFATGFLYASVLSDLVYPFPRVFLS